MRLTLCKLCEYAGRLETGSPMLVGLFSRMNVSQLPARLSPCYLVIEVETDPGEIGDPEPMVVRLIDEDGRMLTCAEGHLEIGPSHAYAPTRTFIVFPMPWDDQFVFEREGVYRFDVVRRPGEPNEAVLGGETLTVERVSRMPWE